MWGRLGFAGLSPWVRFPLASPIAAVAERNHLKALLRQLRREGSPPISVGTSSVDEHNPPREIRASGGQPGGLTDNLIQKVPARIGQLTLLAAARSARVVNG